MMIDAAARAIDRRGVRQGVVTGAHPPQLQLLNRGAVVAVEQSDPDAALRHSDRGVVGADCDRVERGA